ncbi:MAG TPA: SPOR domain-containing protein [Gammaproteobacteria bacterium]
MDISLKQRLVGASVLVALGVIFIPMILERSADDDSLTVRMEIPDKPDVDFKDRLSDPPAIEEIEWPESVQETTAEVRADNAPAETELPKPVQLPQPAKTLTKKPVDKAPTKVPAPTKTAKAPQQWVVQLGSFSKETNALVLQDKLKSGGYKAFVKSADTPAGRVYRVRVGPVSERAEAEQMVAKLGGQGYRAIVMSYPEQTVLP